MAMTVVDLLWGEAKAARSLLDRYTPRMTKQQYLGFLRGLFQESVFPSE